MPELVKVRREGGMLPDSAVGSNKKEGKQTD